MAAFEISLCRPQIEMTTYTEPAIS